VDFERFEKQDVVNRLSPCKCSQRGTASWTPRNCGWETKQLYSVFF